MQRLSPPSPAMGVALLALFVALGGTGYAVLSAAPDKQGVFHACANKKSGALRLVDAGKTCRKKTKKFPGELAVQWSQRGPQGLPGAAGNNGTNGANGANGANGSNGRDGTSVVQRTRGNTEQTTTNVATPYPLASASWTQAAADINEFVGEVIYDPPPSGDCTQDFGGVALPAIGSVGFKLDGTLVGTATMFGAAGDSATAVVAIGALFEPGSDVVRTLTAEISDMCGTGGPGSSAATRYKVKSVKINVLASR